MPTLTLYAIRHDPSGHFLPARKRGRGYSHDTPQSASEVIPRLFVKKLGASRALTAWLQGVFTARFELSNDDQANVEEWLDVDHRPERKADEMSVVPVKVRLP